MRHVIGEKLNAWTPRASWTRRFLRGLDLSFKKSVGNKSDTVPVLEAKDLQTNLKEKLTWMCWQADIPPEHVVNLDGTNISIMPTMDRGWSAKIVATKHLQREKPGVTCTLAIVCPNHLARPNCQISA
eukprot:2041684-Amphidinium_carterae.1